MNRFFNELLHWNMWQLVSLACGIFTVYLMYGKKDEIPVFKAVLITMFGWISLVIWCIANINKKIPNPFIKN